jgi:Tfp pilus assembly PilM family ATPase
MSRATTLPLGIDVGCARTRVALAERTADGMTRLIAVAARPTNDEPAAAILDAFRELGTGERRCVLGMGVPDAQLRAASFPPMRARERARAARFEAARFVAYPPHDTAVRLVATAEGRYAMGIARASALAARTATAKRAGLRPVAVDDIAFALGRAFPYADAIIDIGDAATLLVVPGVPIPAVRRLAVGGRALTAAIVASLGVDEAGAERRKRSIGMGGAGEHVRDALVEDLASALADHRAGARAELRSIALAGNGSRLGGLPAALEAAVAIPVRLGTLLPGACAALPADVVRAAAPDWGLAYGLALWDDAA